MTPTPDALDAAHLLSPASLAFADTGRKYALAPHLAYLNRRLLSVGYAAEGARLIANMPQQHGKQIHDDEEVPTPRGWLRHGGLRPGDAVYAPDGSAVLVEAVGPKAAQDCEVEFSDGQRIRCHENHEWVIYDRGCARWRVMTTKGLEGRTLLSGDRCVLQVANPGPLAGEPWPAPPIHPYALGAWLGDGRADTGQICHGEGGAEVFAALEACGYPASSRWRHKDTGVYYAHLEHLHSALNAAGLLGNKHVPTRYLTAAAWQREELLAGLIDTDGSYSAESGQYRFTNTNVRLVESVIELARSLGFRVGRPQKHDPCRSSSGIEGRKEVWVVAFTASRGLPCRIPRKVPRNPRAVHARGVVAVRRCGEGQGNCIQVEGGQYLVGRTLIPTHNSTLTSKYFPAWLLLNWPDRRVMLLAHEDDFASSFGLQVREVIDRWGRDLGIRLRKDTKAKGEWLIEGADGGMVCCGRGGSVAGRPADVVIIDDLLKDANEALSEAVLEANWRLITSVVLGRLRRQTSLVMVGTRWTRKDHFARMLDEARKAGDLGRWEVVKFKAVAEENDVLGREPGQYLWPAQVNPRDTDFARRTAGRFWRAAWQQDPEDETGSHFKPSAWPRYADLTKEYGQRAWNVPGRRTEIHALAGVSRSVFFPRDLTTFVTVDWAGSERRKADFTAMAAFGLLPDGRLLVLEARAEHLPLEAAVPRLAEFCRRHRPDLVACEADAFQGALANECRRHPGVGEVRRLKSEGKGKLQRALAAVVLAENGRVLLPEGAEWLDAFTTQLAQFTGDGGEHDDLVDCLSYAAKLVGQLMPAGGAPSEGPVLLTEGKVPIW